MRGWWFWFTAWFALGWFVRQLGVRRSQTDELRNTVRELARLTLSMDKRLCKLEGRDPNGDTTDDEFYQRLGL